MTKPPSGGFFTARLSGMKHYRMCSISLEKNARHFATDMTEEIDSVLHILGFNGVFHPESPGFPIGRRLGDTERGRQGETGSGRS